jgi:protein-tyrosine phosphatase
LLVEFSNYAIPPWVETSLQDLLRAGLRPVITHPERNPLLVRRPERVVQWAQMGCVVQVTASSLEGSWGDKAKQVSHFLLRKDAVHVLATDAHNIDGRPPLLSRARVLVAENFGAEIAEALVSGNPGAVVRGEELPYFPEPKA